MKMADVQVRRHVRTSGPAGQHAYRPSPAQQAEQPSCKQVARLRLTWQVTLMAGDFGTYLSLGDVGGPADHVNAAGVQAPGNLARM
jgi:hypothetical protein